MSLFVHRKESTIPTNLELKESKPAKSQMYVRIDSMNIWETKRPQYQNIWTSDLEDGITTDGMTLDLVMMIIIL